MSILIPEEKKGTCVALGNFDGIHPGHREILSACAREAENSGMESIAWSFRRHPEQVMQKNFSSGNIISPEDKKEWIKEIGIHTLVLEDFERVRDYSPAEFCDRILIGSLSAKKVFCGFNFHFGKGGQGDADFLKNYLAPRGIEVFALPAVCYEGEPISSTRIRAMLQNGDMEGACALLGRPYSIRFPVLEGKHMGKGLGFPTINQEFPKEYVTPKKGVYAVRVRFSGAEYFGVCNVGSRPTVDRDDRILAETNLFDFSGDLYGQKVEVAFFSFLRPETKFSGIEELKEQIAKDCAKARQYWKEKL